MAGVAGPALAPADAAEFRARLARRKEQKALTIESIVALEPTRSRRWFHNAMDAKQRLNLSTAVDLAGRMQTLGARLPENVIRRLQRPAPVLFLPPGGANEIADALMPLYGLSGSAKKRVQRETVKFFKRYERVAQTPTVAAAFAQIKSELGGDPHWRHVFAQILAGRAEMRSITSAGNMGARTTSAGLVLSGYRVGSQVQVPADDPNLKAHFVLNLPATFASSDIRELFVSRGYDFIEVAAAEATSCSSMGNDGSRRETVVVPSALSVAKSENPPPQARKARSEKARKPRVRAKAR